MLSERVAYPRRAIQEFPPAIGATIVQRIGAFRAKGAFERADERARLTGRQVYAATLAIRAHLEHQPNFS